MSRESQMVVEIWDNVRDFIPASKRSDAAESIVMAAADYGFEASDLAEMVDVDKDLAEAYEKVFEFEIDEEPEEE